MSRSLTTQDISWFLDLHEKEQLDLDPPYQRRSVWSAKDKRYFVDTILNGYPAPPIFLHKTLDERGRATYHVVDGKQRITTIIEFTRDELRVPDDFGDVTIQKQKWSSLVREYKERFWNYQLIVEMLPNVNDSMIRNIFERINRNSRKLTAQELRHAKYDGWFINLAESEAEQAEWREFGVATTARVKRMIHVQFISELIAVVFRKAISGFDQDDLDEIYARYDEAPEIPAEDDIRASIAHLKRWIVDLIREKSELRDFLKIQAHFYSLWTFLCLESDHFSTLSLTKQAERYFSFISLATQTTADQSTDPSHGFSSTDIQAYAESYRGASTDEAPRQRRHQALVSALGGAGDAP